MDGDYAWILGVQRASVVALLSVFALRSMGFQDIQVSQNSISRLFPHKKTAIVLLTLSLIALPLVIFLLGENTLTATTCVCQLRPEESEFEQVWRPYIWYSLYVYGLWGGMILYFIYCVACSAIYDIRWIRENSTLLLKEIKQQIEKEDTIPPLLDEVEVLFQAHVEAVHDIGQRYAVVVLVLVFALVHEMFLAETVSLISHELAKTALNVVLLFAIFIALLVLARYSRIWRYIADGSMKLAKRSSKSQDHNSYDRWMAFYRITNLEYNPGKLLRGAFLHGRMAMPLTLGLAGFGLSVLDVNADWYTIVGKAVVPEWLRLAFDNLLVVLGNQSPFGQSETME